MKDGETRTYTVPLRREYLKTPKWRRAEKAVSTLRSFVERHSKIEDVKIITSPEEKPKGDVKEDDIPF